MHHVSALVPHASARRNRGFTLLEMLASIVVVGILALIAVPVFRSTINGTTDSVVETSAAAIAREANARAVFNVGSNLYETSEENIDAAINDAVDAGDLRSADGWSVNTAANSVALTKAGSTSTWYVCLNGATPSRAIAQDTACGSSDPTTLYLDYLSTVFSPRIALEAKYPSVWGGSGSVSYSYTGTLPDGVSFNTDTGVFTGPSAWNFEVAGLDAGGAHTCALTTTDGVKCWGYNWAGQLGDGTATSRAEPVNVRGLSFGVAAIAAGDAHTCALTTSGGVKCWGSNDYGQLGDGTTTARTTPVNVSGLNSGVTAIASGNYHTCALTTSGGVKCWGSNDYGQLGDGTTTARTTPISVSGLGSGVDSIAAGGEHSCAVSAGVASCWGWNWGGQLGDGTTTTRTAPVAVTSFGASVDSITGGAGHTCALTVGGGVYCWGSNDYGQVGDGTTTGRTTPVAVSGLAAGVSALDLGGNHACAIVSGSARCWGSNNYGQLGDGTTTARTTPVAVSGLGGVTHISSGGGHTCATSSATAGYCWGNGNAGQRGDGTTTTTGTSPVSISDIGTHVGWPSTISVTATDADGGVTPVTVDVTLTVS